MTDLEVLDESLILFANNKKIGGRKKIVLLQRFLKAFKKNILKSTDDMKNIRRCPLCDRGITYKNEKTYKRQYRLNRPCKYCTSNNTANRRKEEERKVWEPIIGYWGLKYKTLRMIKDHWECLTNGEKIEVLLKTSLQKKYYWGHLRRKNCNSGHRKCRQVMAIKYSGENHWMKRPEVLAKVKKSCEKYRGDGHWFRRGKTI